MKILVVGATGTIGKAIVNLLEKKGESVVSASRSSSPSLNIDDPKSMEAFLTRMDELDAIICAAGNASFGKFAELTDDQINLGIKSKLLGQVNLVRMGTVKLNPGGTLILTGGIFAHKPLPQTSNIAMVNAGLEGFVRAAALEMEENKRVAVVHPPLVKETAVAMGMEADALPSANQVAETYVDILSGISSDTTYFVKGYAP